MPPANPVLYLAPPDRWIKYDLMKVVPALLDAKASVLSLTSVPYQKAWADRLQEIQLKQEVAGTSRIEGAVFTDNELADAMDETVDESGLTRSQRQARAAVNTYRWIARLNEDRPIDAALVLEIHRRIVTGCDDDHCQPGVLRADGENVLFGSPQHRGVGGGNECEHAFASLIQRLNGEFCEHDILVRGLAFHYYIGAMHPFLDGNGRTARAVEALLLQRSGLKKTLFIALSNYYHDEKANYLKALASVRNNGGDLTEFLIFGLKGVTLQCQRLLNEININIKKVLFRDVATDLFGRLNGRKRVIAKRQMGLLEYLLDRGDTELNELFRSSGMYRDAIKEPWAAFIRDLQQLHGLGCLTWRKISAQKSQPIVVNLLLDWPTKITETTFFEESRSMPRAKTLEFMRAEYGPQQPIAND